MPDWKAVSESAVNDSGSVEQRGLSPAGMHAMQGNTDAVTASLPEDADGNKIATIHAGNEIEKEPSPEGEPQTVYPEGRKPAPPEGWHPGGPEGGY